MNKLDLVLQIVGRLRHKADKLQNESYRNLLLAVMFSIANLVTFGVTGAAYLIFGTVGATLAAFYLTASIVLPITAIVGLCAWAVTEYFWSKATNPVLKKEYLEYEFKKDIENIKSLPLTPAQQRPLILERYKQFQKDSAREKEMVPLPPRDLGFLNR